MRILCLLGYHSWTWKLQVDCSTPYPVVCTHPSTRVESPYGQYRGYRVVVCTKCGKTISTEDSTD